MAITTSGVCTGSGSGSATILMTNGTGVCTINYNQSGPIPYAPAAQVSSATTATKTTQAIIFPGQTTTSRIFANLSTFAISPLATGGGSGNAVTYSSLDTGKCTVAGTTVTMKGVGNCVIAADQAGNANYAAATQTTQIVQLTKALQTINVTVHAPGIKGNGQSFSVTANAAPSGLPVSINGYGSCSGTGTGTVTITMTAAVGVCSVVYTQDGDVNYEPANPVTEYVAPDTGGSGCLGEGTYTGLKFSQSGAYIGWACNDGDFIAPGHSVSCWPPLYLPWIRPGWSIQPGSGFKGHVLQTKLNPGKTFKVQAAPGGGGYFNVLNETDKTCIASGNGVYEFSGTRRGANASAGYLVAIQDSATMPSGRYCDYSAAQTKWKINFNTGYVTFETAGYPNWPSHGCMGTTATAPYGLDRVLLDWGNGNYGNWGDSWVRNAAPSCAGNAAKMTCGGYTPPAPDHIRFEFNASAAYTCMAPTVTARICSNAMPAIGSAGTCSVFGGVGVVTPRSSRGTWAGLTSAPSTRFTGSSAGITLAHTVVGESVDLSYAYPSLTLADSTLECYDTSSNKRVSCTAAMTYKTCPPFDAVEPGAATGTNLYTKLAGTPFDFDVVGINTYTGDVTVELVDVSGGAAVCPDSGAKLTTVNFSQPSAVNNSITYAYVAGDAGRKTFQAKFDNAAASVRVRIKDKTSACFASSDTFTIRPASLALAASYSATPPVAGVAFNLTATAKNSGNVTTAAYTGTPALTTDSVTDWTTAAIPGGSLVGSFTAAVAGVASGDAADPFKYRNIGPVTFPNATATASPVSDTTYTSVSSDQANGDCIADSYSNVLSGGMYGCNIGSNALTTDRFIPDHYEVENVMTTGCTAGNFSYFGQIPASAPTVLLKAMSADNFQMTRLLDGYDAAHKPAFTVEAMNGVTSLANPATSLVNLTAPANLWPAVDPGGIYQNIENGLVARPAVTAPANPPSYESFALRTTVTDGDGVLIKKCNGVAHNATSCSSVPTRLRFGVLKLDSAYGPETLPLFLPVRAMYWNGTQWTRNTDDSCTKLVTATANPARNIAIGNFKGGLASGDITISAADVTLASGMASIRIESPGAGKQGGAEVALNLNPAATANDSSCIVWGAGALAPNVTAGAGLEHLKGTWCGNTYVRDPNANIRFGVPKSQFLYMRERY